MSARGCGSGTSGLASASVCTGKNLFTLSGSSSGSTGSESYSWDQSRDEVRASLSSSVTSGSWSLTVKDAAGAVVYQKTVKPGSVSVSEVSEKGKEGEWSANLAYTACSCSISLSVAGT